MPSSPTTPSFVSPLPRRLPVAARTVAMRCLQGAVLGLALAGGGGTALAQAQVGADPVPGLGALTQRWLDNRNLKLRIYRERTGEPHGHVDIVIEAWPRKDSDDIEFRGGYVLTIFDIPKAGADGKTTTLKGRVTCSAG